MTVLLRDILFPPPLESYPIHLICLALSVLLLLMFTYFYARKDWRRYTKRNLWLLFVVDMAIAGLYNYVIASNPINAYTDYFAHGDMDPSNPDLRVGGLLHIGKGRAGAIKPAPMR